MDTPKNTRASGLGSALIMATALIALPAFATDDTDNGPRNSTVNCHSDDASIQRQIDEIRPGRKAIIFINGQCDEDVLIERDDITLSGNKDGDGTIDGGVTGTITVVGARRVTIEYLYLTGTNQGIQALDGATVDILHNRIENNMSDGIGAFNNVFLRVNSNIITGNGQTAPQEAGINAAHNTTVRAQDNLIADNAYAAVLVGNASHWRSDGGDTLVERNCRLKECHDFGSYAIDCYRVASCHVTEARINGDISLTGFTFLDVRGTPENRTAIRGNVEVSRGSGVRFRNDVRHAGIIQCFGGEGVAFQNAKCAP